ncbi:AMP-binding protein [Alienimonas chondri]|uniref:Bifunctional protein Aas n=1 Tax=Alienimonas chondri TaxID=2681879 RepID=A0ABX1VCW2_9PLAN|nr:AMP-binding protein [Alienimonas chondri]NNJ25732.1 Bifunctional protein Aas [Alienimonas chondri]
MSDAAPPAVLPPLGLLARCKADAGRMKVADALGTELTGKRLLIGTLLFRSLLRKHVLDANETHVGILLPPSVGAVLANTALTIDGRVTVNVNYTLSDEVANHCLREAGVKHVLTSRAFLKKRPMELNAEYVYLEDLKEQAGGLDKLKAAAHAALPLGLLTKSLGLDRLDPHATLTVVFTSGSTGEPKGVELTHHSVGSVLAAIEPLAHPVEEDVTLGVLPFFHSFGYTATLWWPLCLPGAGVYGPNPLDSRTVGKLGEKYRPTITFATPTFLRGYLKRCTPEQLGNLNLVVVGGEQLPADLREAWEEKFGIAPTEGYGATELSPVVACNVPPVRQHAGDIPGLKHGTIGRPLPGVKVRVVSSESGEEVPLGEEGILEVGGATVMKGYLNDPEKTAKAVRDGWYDTGDMAKLDADDFIHITGRLSRFSKIGGEMVPHLKIEEALLKACACGPDEPGEEGEAADGPTLAVSAVPDPKKGERIVVLYRDLGMPLEELRAKLNGSGLPNLWLPAADAFYQVEEIPVLGTGKLDLKALKTLAVKRAAGG